LALPGNTESPMCTYGPRACSPLSLSSAGLAHTCYTPPPPPPPPHPLIIIIFLVIRLSLSLQPHTRHGLARKHLRRARLQRP
jgi:hypothetical protein